MRPTRAFAVAFLIVMLGAQCAVAQIAEFESWPAGISPKEVGRRVAERFVTGPHHSPNSIDYPEVCTWYGALRFAELTRDQDLASRLKARFDPLMTSAQAHMIPPRRHVDDSIFGAIPLEIYRQSRGSEYLDFGLKFADRQWENPDAQGLSPETRFWIDDMYMLTILQVQAYRATGQAKYIDRAALELVAYLDKLQRPNGLFYHAPDAPFYWGRGNGWVAAGMTELLTSLPKDHPHRPRILKGYQSMMAALLRYQAKDGMWRQLIDHPEAWPESSSTAMFTFAMITGVKQGWLKKQAYAPAARKAWIALAGYVDQNADVTSVCEGTGKNNNVPYYLARARRTGDMHGQAPVLWCAFALLQ